MKSHPDMSNKKFGCKENFLSQKLCVKKVLGMNFFGFTKGRDNLKVVA